uniref:site-specific DNA-methyltransferase (adenine-specific) n=1 Tax=viral metagenome TaxID=1070528 RepID=A0A6C0CUE5_9ZZZZ
MEKYSDLSKKLTKNIDTNEKKKNGIYFTPATIIKKNIDALNPYFSKIKTVLEPSCGSCEFLNYIDDNTSSIEMTGIENNQIIYEEIKKISFKNPTQIIHTDFLEWTPTQKYDLIIGNPPYFVMKKDDVSAEYYDYFDGRPNIFTLFIVKSLHMLNPNGILSFILPKSFTNCLYYDKLRKYIADKYSILELIDCSDDSFIETKQETILFMVQNRTNPVRNAKYMIHISDYTILNTPENIVKMRELYKDSTTLNKLNFSVSVGNVVWNQCKAILTNDTTKTRLIYSSDIVDSKLVLKEYTNKEKKNYIDKKGSTDVILVINRGYGVGDYQFHYCIIDVDYPYLVENHLICVKYGAQKTKPELLQLYDKVIQSLNHEKTNEFINLYFGNNAINTTELNYILPIYISSAL